MTTIHIPSKYLMATLLTVLLLASYACTSSANTRDRDTVDTQQGVYQRNQPIPTFEFSQDRATFSQLYVLRNEVRPTYTIVRSQGTGTIEFECASRGYAIPADTQLTNPLGQLVVGSQIVVEQPEPNGLFSSKNTDGTWVLCVRDDGSIHPVYTESKVTTFPFQVEHGQNEVQVHDAQQASSTTVTLQNAQGTKAGNAPTPVASPGPYR